MFAGSAGRSRILRLLGLILLGLASSATDSSSTWSSPISRLVRIPGVSHVFLTGITRTTWVIAIFVILNMHGVFFTF